MDEFAPPRWRKWVLNRFVATAAIIGAIALGWDLYAATHANGLVAGQVVDRAGNPVEGAEVTLWVFTFTTFKETTKVATGPDGGFRFTDNPSHNIQVSAQKPGLGASDRVPIRLFFKAQDTVLKEPLVLSGAS